MFADVTAYLIHEQQHLCTLFQRLASPIFIHLVHRCVTLSFFRSTVRRGSVQPNANAEINSLCLSSANATLQSPGRPKCTS